MALNNEHICIYKLLQNVQALIKPETVSKPENKLRKASAEGVPQKQN